jgi:hypothetical protein
MNPEATARALRSASPTTRAKLRAVLEEYAAVVDGRLAAMQALSASELELRGQLTFSRGKDRLSHEHCGAGVDGATTNNSNSTNWDSNTQVEKQDTRRIHETFQRLSDDVSRVFRHARVQRMRSLARERDDRRPGDFDGLEVQSMLSGSREDIMSSEGNNTTPGGPSGGPSGGFRYRDIAEMGVPALLQGTENETRQNKQLRETLQRLQKERVRISRNRIVAEHALAARESLRKHQTCSCQACCDVLVSSLDEAIAESFRVLQHPSLNARSQNGADAAGSARRAADDVDSSSSMQFQLLSRQLAKCEEENLLLKMRRNELRSRKAIASFRNEIRRLLSLPQTISLMGERVSAATPAPTATASRVGDDEESGFVVLPRVRACLARFDAAFLVGAMCGAENVRFESLRSTDRLAEVAARLAVLGTVIATTK